MTHLNVPGSLSKAVEAEFVSDLGSVHGIGQILLVGEDKEERITELILVQHPLQFLTSLGNTLSIVGIDNKNDTLGVLEVCSVMRKATRISGGGRVLTYNASRGGESYLDLRHPIR